RPCLLRTGIRPFAARLRTCLLRATTAPGLADRPLVSKRRHAARLRLGAWRLRTLVGLASFGPSSAASAALGSRAAGEWPLAGRPLVRTPRCRVAAVAAGLVERRPAADCLVARDFVAA